MIYVHRNGETEAPTQKGRYWFRGVVDSRQYAELTDVLTYSTPVAWYETYYDGWYEDVKSFVGQWWGPVLAPWEELQP